MKTVEVLGMVHHKVSVSPLDVVEKLLEEVKGGQNVDLSFSNGRHYLSTTTHGFEVECSEVDAQTAEYIQALDVVVNYLKFKNYK